MIKTKSTATVFIIDDDAEVCLSLGWLLTSAGLHVKTFTNPCTFLDTFTRTSVGCIIIDVCMPQMNGLQLIEQLNLRKNKLPIFMLSGCEDIPTVVKSIKIGAIDYILKPFNELSFIDIIKKRLKLLTSAKTIDPALTPREQQILELLMAGKINKQIAHELHLSISTIEIHRSRIMKKMQAKNLPELVKNYLSWI